MQEGVQRDPSGKSRVCILTHKQVDAWSGDHSRQHLAFMWRSSVHKLAQKHLWLTFNEMSANMSFILFGDCHAHLCVCERESERERGLRICVMYFWHIINLIYHFSQKINLIYQLIRARLMFNSFLSFVMFAKLFLIKHEEYNLPFYL